LEDPKDFLPIFEHIKWLNGLFSPKHFEEAKKGWLGVVSLRPKLFAPHIQLGSIALEERRPADAIHHFTTAISILTESEGDPVRSPHTAEAHDYWIARCHLGRSCALTLEGNPDQAAIEYRGALRIDPDSATELILSSFFRAHYDRGVALQGQGKIDEAITHYQNALKIRPDSVATHNALGTALQDQGKFTEAISHYQKALEVDPKYAPAQNNLAWVLATCPEESICNGTEAVELAERAVRLSDRRDPASLDTLAAAYAEAQQFSKAVATAQEALALAKSAQQTTLADGIQSRLDLYRVGRPYRETLRKTSPLPVGP